MDVSVAVEGKNEHSELALGKIMEYEGDRCTEAQGTIPKKDFGKIGNPTKSGISITQLLNSSGTLKNVIGHCGDLLSFDLLEIVQLLSQSLKYHT